MTPPSSIPNLNPYIAGREAILQQLTHWPSNRKSVLLYGPRQIGKTSLLQHLTKQMEPRFIYVNLLIASTTGCASELLMLIVNEIATNTRMQPPSDDEIMDQPEDSFEHYLKQVITQTGPIVLALDEYEVLWNLTDKGVLGQDFFIFLRQLMQTPSLGFLLTGLHSLEEQPDYFQPITTALTPMRLSSYLDREAVAALLHNQPYSSLSYTQEAINRIFELTHGQPKLCGLAGLALSRQPHKKTITRQDVEQIITGDFSVYSASFFSDIWRLAANDYRQQFVLQALADRALSFESLFLKLPFTLSETELHDVLKILSLRDVIQCTDQQAFAIAIPLFARWINHNHSTD